MLSKLYSSANVVLRPALSMRYSKSELLAPRCVLRAPARQMNFGLKSQYSNNKIPNRLKISYAARHYWETIPLFVVCIFDIMILAGAIFCGFTTRVDVQLSHARNNSIARTMDLRNPTIHKHLVFYQRYEPWPEMQMVLDKMCEAEKRAMTRLETCGKV